MTLKEKLIANRMSVAFMLYISVLLSTTPAVFLGEVKLFIIPILITVLLILWLAYSSIAKKRLIVDEKIPLNKKDFIDNFMWDFKPNSKIKILFGAVGLSGGVIIVLASILVIISPEMLEHIFLSFYGHILTYSLVIVFYFLLKKRLR